MNGKLLTFVADESCDFGVVEIVTEHGAQLKGTFVVLEPGRARIRSI